MSPPNPTTGPKPQVTATTPTDAPASPPPPKPVATAPPPQALTPPPPPTATPKPTPKDTKAPPPPVLVTQGVGFGVVKPWSVTPRILVPVADEEDLNKKAARLIKEGMDEESRKKLTGGAPASPSSIALPGFAKNVGGVPAGDVGVGVTIRGDIVGDKGKPSVQKVTVEVGGKTPVGGVGVKTDVVEDKPKPPPPKPKEKS